MDNCMGDYIWAISKSVVEPLQSCNKGVSLMLFGCTYGWQLVLENPLIKELIKAILMQVFAG